MHLIKLDKDPNVIPSKDITYYLNPDFIYIPTKDILVNQDEYVYKNEVVSKKGHTSSVSGQVIGISKSMKNTLVIANDFREMDKTRAKKKRFSVANLLQLVEHDKRLFAKFKSNKYFNNIIVSSIDDAPYVYNKMFLLKENILDILEMMENLRVIYKCDNNMLVVKNSDASIIDECLNTIGSYPNIKLTLVNDWYLLEQEGIICETLHPKGSTLVLSINDIVKLINLFKGVVSTTKLITIAGDAISKSKVLRVKKYTLVKDCIDKYIDLLDTNVDYYINNIMLGNKVSDISKVIVTEEINSITIMKKKRHIINECIKCGKCLQVCPYQVNHFNNKNKDKCINCGLCSYICPCNIDLRRK